MKNVSSLKANLTKNVNARKALEAARMGSESKVALLDRAYKRLQSADVLAHFAAADLNFDFMNAESADNKVFNVKALDKVARIAATLASGRDTLDNFSRAIIRSARVLAVDYNVTALRNNDLQGMLCKSVETEHRVRFVQAAGATPATASSQFSSTRAALVVLGLASVANKGTRDELTTIRATDFTAVA